MSSSSGRARWTLVALALLCLGAALMQLGASRGAAAPEAPVADLQQDVEHLRATLDRMNGVMEQHFEAVAGRDGSPPAPARAAALVRAPAPVGVPAAVRVAVPVPAPPAAPPAETETAGETVTETETAWPPTKNGPLPRAIVEPQYRDDPNAGSEMEHARETCQALHKKHRVVPGSSWGSLSKDQRSQWISLSCDDFVVNTGVSTAKGTVRTMASMCEPRWGREFLETWKADARDVCAGDGQSHIMCKRNEMSGPNQACLMTNVAVDYGRMSAGGGKRSFQRGALSADCREAGFSKGGHPLLGSLASAQALDSVCAEWEETPTVVITHDDIGNTYHSLADFWRLWLDLEVLGVDASQAQLVNMDQRIMCGSADSKGQHISQPLPDCEGPYFDQYRTWFKALLPARDMGSRTVCYRQLVVADQLNINHIWTDFHADNRCSKQGASALVMQYARFVQERWGVWNRPPPDEVLLLYLVRDKKPFSHARIVERVVRNRAPFVSMLEAVPGVTTVRAVDFATISYKEQVELVSRASILVGMHGAGMVHVLNMPQNVRTAAVELFPHGHAQRGVANLVRHAGVQYYSWTSESKSRESHAGTDVDLDAVRKLVEAAVGHVRGS